MTLEERLAKLGSGLAERERGNADAIAAARKSAVRLHTRVAGRSCPQGLRKMTLSLPISMIFFVWRV